MKTKDLQKQILGGETPYQETIRLRKEIAAASKRIAAIHQEAEAERIRVGLRKMARRKIPVDIKQMNHICLSGRFRTRDWTAKEFGLESHHGIISADIEPGIHASVSIDDTWLSIQVTWKISDKEGALAEARSNVVQNYTRAKKFFKKYGIQIDCEPAVASMLGKMDDLVAAAALIHVFHSTGNSQRLVYLAKEMKSGLSLAYKAKFVKS